MEQKRVLDLVALLGLIGIFAFTAVFNQPPFWMSLLFLGLVVYGAGRLVGFGTLFGFFYMLLALLGVVGECSQCNGTGGLVCTNCNGTGCTECDQEGALICPNCDGDGYAL